MRAAIKTHSGVGTPIPKPIYSLSASMGNGPREEIPRIAEHKRFNDILADVELAKEMFPPDYFLLVE